MSAFPAPVVASYGDDGTEADGAPLVVLLHGRGSDEREILRLAALLPTGPRYVAVRAPITEGGGYAWFANRGIGRPVAESLRETTAWFRVWLDSTVPSGQPVVLVGFSGGAAFAGGLALADPARFAGLAVLHGTLPFGAGVPTDAGRLTRLPVLVAQGDTDAVIPRELLDRTWAVLTHDADAPVVAHRHPGGHELPGAVVEVLGEWVGSLVTGPEGTRRHDPVSR